MTRPRWTDYFMSMAALVSTRATCARKHVGAVLVKDNRVIATGYNGAPSGLPHCDDVGHEMKEIDGRPSCIRTLHGESNAIDFAGKATEGCILYTTVIPCHDCAKRLINAGVEHVVYYKYYESRNTKLVEELFPEAGVSLRRWEGEGLIDLQAALQDQ